MVGFRGASRDLRTHIFGFWAPKPYYTRLLGYFDAQGKLETGLRPNSAGIPYTVLLLIEAIGFPTFGFYCRASGSGLR